MLNHLFWAAIPIIITIIFCYLGFSEHHAVRTAAGNRQTTFILKKHYSALRQRLVLSGDVGHTTTEGTGGSIWLLRCSSSESFLLLTWNSWHAFRRANTVSCKQIGFFWPMWEEKIWNCMHTHNSILRYYMTIYSK